MSKLSDFRVLSFDIYGTLIDWESGVVDALKPLLEANQRTDLTRKQLLETYQRFEAAQQKKTPDMAYSKLLATIHPHIAESFGLQAPTAEDSEKFGQSIGRWPAFPDTIDALHRLSKHYKLVVHSNVDRESFAKTNAGPLEKFPFDLIVTAQDAGSYKPDLRNFEYLFNEVDSKLGFEREKVLKTAQSQFHDHHPTKQMGLQSCWIVRPGAIMGNESEEIFDWKFDTLGQMADAVEKS